MLLKLTPVVNLANILEAAFALIFFCQKITKLTNFIYTKASKNTFEGKKLFLWNVCENETWPNIVAIQRRRSRLLTEYPEKRRKLDRFISERIFFHFENVDFLMNQFAALANVILMLYFIKNQAAPDIE